LLAFYQNPKTGNQKSINETGNLSGTKRDISATAARQEREKSKV
jgi:hypothetical protein